MNAIFFAAHLSQVSIPFLKANEWDPAGLDSEKMCGGPGAWFRFRGSGSCQV